MVMKDISAIDDLERGVREDPTVLPEVADRVYDQLDSDDRAERMDAGRALRAAADHDPELAEPFRDALVDLLDAENDSLRLSGAIGVAQIAAVAPEDVADAVPALVDVLEGTAAPSIEEGVIRALTRLGMYDPALVADADPVLADRLLEATFPVQTVITRSFIGAVVESPSLFPETIDAYATLLEREDGARARFAADALARVASADPSALPEPERVLGAVERLEAKFDADPRHGVGDDVKEAARTLRAVRATGS